GSTAWREVTLETEPAGDVIQVDLAVANVGDGAFDSVVVVDFVEEIGDRVQPALAWNATAGGLDLSYEVSEELLTDVEVAVHFANGTGYANRLGAALHSVTVPAGTPAGSYGPVAIAGGDLADDPAGTTHLVASASPTAVAALADVQV